MQNTSLAIACSDAYDSWVDTEGNGYLTCSDPRKGLMWVDTNVKGKILVCPANGWRDSDSLELPRSCGRKIADDRAGGMIEMVSKWSGTRYYVGGAKDLILDLTAEVVVMDKWSYELYAESVRLGGLIELYPNGLLI